MDNLKILFGVIVVISIHNSIFNESATLKEVKKLSKHLLDDYDKTLLPTFNQSADFIVEAVIELRSISDLDEIQGRMTTVMMLQMFWRDESMVWDKRKWSGIDHITMEAEKVWTPRLAVPNSYARSHRIHDWDLIDYLPNGDTRWITMKTFETSCDLDTTFYPFDIQQCSVELFIYGYYGRISFIPALFDELHMSEYEPQGTWNVTDYYVATQNGSNVTLTYHLARNPRYMILNFLLPIIVLSLLNPLVFLLPPDAGERIGYSMTIMLALSVYMTILGDYLPQNSDPIPLMTYKIIIWYILSAMTLIFLFLSTRIHYKPNSHPMPRCVQTFVVVLKAVFCLKCCREERVNTDDNEQPEDTLQDTDTGQSDKSQQKQQKSHNRQRNSACSAYKQVTWQSASKALDIFFMVLIYLVKILFMVIFMHLLSSRPDLDRVKQ